MTMTILTVAFLLGLVAGLCAMTAPALTSWAAHAGVFPVAGTWLGFMASPWAVGILSLLALGELVTDLLPSTPSRKVPMQFRGRLLGGALVGATVGAGSSSILAGALCGIVGAVVGTYGGAASRGWLARRLRSDTPAGISEDIVAIAVGLLAIALL